MSLVSLTSGTLRDACFLMGQQVCAMIPDHMEPIFQVFSTKLDKHQAEQWPSIAGMSMHTDK